MIHCFVVTVHQLVWLMLLFAGFAAPAATVPGLPPATLERTLAATARVTSSAGTIAMGFLIGERLLITQAGSVASDWERPQEVWHVVLGPGTARERVLSATIIGWYARRDLVFLRLDPGSDPLPPPLAFAPVTSLRETMPVTLIGGGTGTGAVVVERGSLSGFRRAKDGRVELVQVDGRVVSGDGGAPFILDDGKVAAVALGGIVDTRLCFGLPGDAVDAAMVPRVLPATTGRVHRVGDRFAITLQVQASDPRDRLTQVAVDWWVAPIPDATAPSEPDRAIPADLLAKPPRSRVGLKRTPDGGFVGELANLRLAENDGLWCRTLGTRRGGEVVRSGVCLDLRTRTTSAEWVIPRGAPVPVESSHPPLPIALIGDGLDGSSLHLVAAAESITLARPCTALVATSSGRRLYATAADAGSLLALDPVTLAIHEEFALGATATQVTGDDRQAVVLCAEQHELRLVTLGARPPVRLLPLLGHETDSWPLHLVGPLADWGLCVLWNVGGDDDPGYRLALHDRSGPVRLLPAWPGLTPQVVCDGELLLDTGGPTLSGVQGETMPGYNGNQPDLTMRRTISATPLIVPGIRMGLLPLSLNTQAGSRQLTWALESRGGVKIPAWTLPGLVVAAVPAVGLVVSFGRPEAGSDTTAPFAIWYTSLADHRVRRRIDVIGYPADFPSTEEVTAVYVPGHELLYLLERPAGTASGRVVRIRCGPVAPGSSTVSGLAPGVEGVLGSKDDYAGPPITARPGSTVTYQPLVNPKDDVEYAMVRPVPGMQIDSRTGAWSWTPTANDLGIWEVEIVAKRAGSKQRSIRWQITVDD